MNRITFIVFAIAGLFLLSFLAFGDSLDQWFLNEQGLDWLRQQGAWAGLVGAGLIISDLFLPIPVSAVMVALGQIYGGLIGGMYAALGSTGAGLFAYVSVRALGPRAALVIAGDESLWKLQRFFNQRGATAIALTRVLPVVPEVLCCLAGLTPMPFSRFLVALLCGSVPMSFVFASFGSLGAEEPITTLLIAAALPVLIFPPIWLLLQQRK